MKTGRFHGGLAVVFKVGQVVPANPRERPAGETQGAGMTGGGWRGGGRSRKVAILFKPTTLILW